MGLTIKDIAKMANTSTATISRVLSGAPGVSDEKRKQMMDLLDRIGYRPNRIAQNLVRGKSNTIGVIVSNLRIAFYIDTISHIERLCREKGYQILVVDSYHNPDQERENIEILREHRIEGLFVIPVYDYNMTVNIDHFVRLRLEHFPFVVIGRTPQHDIDWVTVEETQTAYEVVQHLLELGHRRFAFLGHDPVNRAVVERYAGIAKALAERGMSLAPRDIVMEVGTWEEGGETAWEEQLIKLFSQEKNPTALVAANDTIALICIRKLEAMGYRIPDDISVVGFDDSPWARLVHPSITTCAKDMGKVGRIAVDMLMRRIMEPNLLAQQQLISQVLIPRSSSGPAPGLSGTRIKLPKRSLTTNRV